MMVGVRYQLSARSRVYVDTASWSDGELPERDVRMGFEFKSAPSKALGLARGTLFRVQWSSHSQVSLRLRSGGVAVALRSQFYWNATSAKLRSLRLCSRSSRCRRRMSSARMPMRRCWSTRAR